MSIYRESKADILSYFNRKLGLSLALSDVTFSVGATNDNSSYSANSKCRVTIKASNPTYTGSTVIYYNRDDIGTFVGLGQPTNPFVGNVGDSIYTLLPSIAACMGLNFTTDDLVETFVTDNGNGASTLAITAKSTSVGFTGTGTITLKGKPTLASMFTTDAVLWS